METYQYFSSLRSFNLKEAHVPNSLKSRPHTNCTTVGKIARTFFELVLASGNVNFHREKYRFSMSPPAYRHRRGR